MSERDRELFAKFAPFVPVEAGGLMPAGRRDAIAAALTRTLNAQPPSRNVEDRTGESAIGEFFSNTFDPRRWMYRTQMQPPPQPYEPPGELAAAAGYFDVIGEPVPPHLRTAQRRRR